METQEVQPLTYKPDVAAARLGVSRSTMDRLIANGEIRARRAGRRVLVSEQAIQEFIAQSDD